MGPRTVCAILAVAASACTFRAPPAPAPEAGPELQGAALFARHCSSCHTAGADARAPAPDALRLLAPEQIVLALTNGAMRLEGSRIGGVERRAIAEYLTGRPVAGDAAGAATGRCAAGSPFADPLASPMWASWGADPSNTRFQSADQAGLSVADVPRLTLKWALGYPDATHAWGQPTVAAGRVFVGSHNGTVYSLDARTGCIHWTFAAGGGVRTAITIAPRSGAPGWVLYFGDTNATAYALDAATGTELWRQKLDEHTLARVTGSVAVHEGRLFVPISSYEEVGTANATYECCTFRGSLLALDAASGRILWKTYTAGEPRPRGQSLTGATLWGPSGAAIWTTPTVDPRRGVVYASTGNNYSDPAEGTSDAVIAFDMQTGRIRWVQQVTENDVYIGGCPANSGNPNCPEAVGPDYDFGQPAILTTLSGGRDLLVIGQKSGIGYALDPDAEGAVLWSYRAGRGGALGGIQYGSAVDGARAYFPVSDIQRPEPGGLHAVDLRTGERVWYSPPPPPTACGEQRSCNAAQAAAITVIPGVVFSGSNDGVMRAFATADGSVIWEYDTNREFQTVNGVPARGASILGPGPAIAGGMLFVNSGYGSHGGRAGNVLLAFGLD